MLLPNLCASLGELLDLLVRSPDCQLARHYSLEPAARALAAWQETLQRDSSQLVVTIVGEFKAGKSALLNAMCGRKVAFSDPFDATMTSAAVYSDETEYVDLHPSDGPTRRCTLDEYLTACEHRQLHNIVRADVHVTHCGHYVLIDTPGLATINAKHTERAESAIKEAHVVVWVIDPSDFLSAQEGAFLRRAREIGLPIVPVLGKADTLSDDDIDECVSCLSNRLGYRRDEIIALSAERHIASKNDPGVLKLIASLDLLARNATETQLRASSAKYREVVEESLRVATVLQNHLSRELKWAIAERALILHQERLLRERLLSVCRTETVSTLRSHLAERIPGSVSTANVHAICQGCLEGIGDQGQPISIGIVQRMQQEAREVWDQPFQERSADLQKQIQQLMTDSLANCDTIEFLSTQLDEVQKRRSALNRSIEKTTDRKSSVGETVIEVVGAIVGIFTGSARPWLAGKVIALLGRVFRGSTAINLGVISRDECIDAICNAVAEETCEDTSGSIERYIRAVANDALERLCKEKFNGRSIENIESCKDRVEHVIHDLDALRQQLTSTRTLSTTGAEQTDVRADWKWFEDERGRNPPG
jgi:GTPase Era involved in 16S rRNA processing